MAFTPRTQAESGRSGRGVEMDDLPACMHAAVGAARAGDVDRRIGDAGKRGLEHILHGAAAGLGLPAEEAATDVFNAECYAD